MVWLEIKTMISGITDKIIYLILLGSIGLLSACGAAAPEDIPVTPSVQPQPTPLATPIMEIKSDSVPVPTASLPAEITEPTSPDASCKIENTTPCAPTPAIAEHVSPISPPPAEPARPAPEALVVPNTQSVQPLPGSETALAAAIADLAKQIGVPADQITLVSMEAKEWSDAALGCPQEGMMYAQVITPGFLMILSAQGQQYEYHTDQKTNIIWCKK